MKRYNSCYIRGKLVWLLEYNSNDTKQVLSLEEKIPSDYYMSSAVKALKNFVKAWMYIGTDKVILNHYGSWENAVSNMRKVTARYTAPKKVTYEFEDAKGFVSEDIYRHLKSEGCPRLLQFGVLSISFTLKECIFECSRKIKNDSLAQSEILYAFIKYPFLLDICQQNQIYRSEIGTKIKKIVFDRKDYAMIYCKYFNTDNSKRSNRHE